MEDEEYDSDKTTAVSAQGYHGNRGRKRKRTSEEEDLDTAAELIMTVCDSTSDSSDEAETMTYEPTPDDRRYMKLAQHASTNSKDEETKVGAVLVKDGMVLGTGWNRMPKGCESLPWVRDRDKESLDQGKHLYVVYAIPAAMFDAYKKKADLIGATLYTTMFPSYICAQYIREAEISKVVWCSDKFHNTMVMKASRRILKGIECRPYNVKD